MARIRTIKPQFFLNEQVAELPAMTRLLFIGLWTQADRSGKLIDRPKRLKAEIFPYDNYSVEKGLNELSEAGFIIRYKVNANDFVSILAPEQPIKELAIIRIENFSRHQKIDKINEAESELPDPQQDYQKTSTSLVKVEEGKGKEGKGRERISDASPPSIEQVKEYFSEHGYSPDTGAKAWKYYETGGWKDSKGNKVRNWKQKMQSVWFKDENRAKPVKEGTIANNNW